MRYSMLSVLFASTVALGQPITSQAPQLSENSPGNDGPGSGVQLELGVFGTSGLVNFVDGVVTGGAGATLTGTLGTPTPAVSVGYQWNQNAILLGLGFASEGGAGFDSPPEILFGIGPTFRRYLSPLRTGGFSAFGEGSVALVLGADPNGGPAAIGFGVDAGLGGEWLFVRNFGLFAKATLGYEHFNGGGVNVDGLGLSGDIGLTVHL
jgi:hypothetical protein